MAAGRRACPQELGRLLLLLLLPLLSAAGLRGVAGACVNRNQAECDAWGAASCIFPGVPEACPAMCNTNCSPSAPRPPPPRSPPHRSPGPPPPAASKPPSPRPPAPHPRRPPPPTRKPPPPSPARPPLPQQQRHPPPPLPRPPPPSPPPRRPPPPRKPSPPPFPPPRPPPLPPPRPPPRPPPLPPPRTPPVDARITLATYLTAAMFESLFLHRNDPACAARNFYTYQGLLDAAATFPGFGTSSADAAVNRREVAAFLAQISHETTGGWATAPDGPYSWGLCWNREGPGVAESALPAYCDAGNARYPCAAGRKYYGRGPMQLSWNYNYGLAGDDLNLPLLSDPDLVLSSSAVAFRTALWFWMTPQAPKPSCHDVMTGRWQPSAADTAAGRVPGFGMTTNIINGGLECGFTPIPSNQADRIGYYKRYAGIFGVDVGANLECGTQRSF